jgi:hypothetical protein
VSIPPGCAASPRNHNGVRSRVARPARDWVGSNRRSPAPVATRRGGTRQESQEPPHRPARAPACGGGNRPWGTHLQKARRSLRARRASGASASPPARGAPRLRRFETRPREPGIARRGSIRHASIRVGPTAKTGFCLSTSARPCTIVPLAAAGRHVRAFC